MNPERPSAPDVDSDFDFLRIEEVVDYMRDNYGRNHVAKIGTYTTMTSRMALKDAGRVLGFDHSYMNYLTANIPASGGNVMRIEDAVKNIKELKQAYEEYPELFDLGIDLQGIPRSKSIHAAGVIITPQELDRVLPLDVAKGEVVTQYDGGTLEDMGYFKFDILAIKYLSVLRIALDLIKERHGKDINIYELELDDKNVYRMIQEGNTMGLFQLAGEGMTEVFTGLEEVDFETLSAGIALYR